jgi:hypothetical protein
LKAHSSQHVFVELAVADDVSPEQIIHTICALREAGFREIALVDELP